MMYYKKVEFIRHKALSLGYGDIIPRTDGERAFCVAVRRERCRLTHIGLTVCV